MYAVIDVGSNTIRLVLYRIKDGELRQILSSKESAGLAGYTDKQGRMTQKGICRLVSALLHFREIVESVGTPETFVFATASLRNVANTEEILEKIRTDCGMEVRVLTGREEAMLDYFGAARSLGQSGGLLADVGGGSTELVFFSAGTARAACSVPIGSLNLYNEFVKEILPSKKELDRIREYTELLLKAEGIPVGTQPSGMLCGVGGTARASCLLCDELFDTQNGYGGFPAKRMKKMLRMCSEDKARLLQAMLRAAPDRLHTLLPGLAILETVAGYYGCTQFFASPYGVREGYLLRMLEGGDADA